MHTSFADSINVTLFYFKCVFHLKNATNLGNRNAETVKKSQKIRFNSAKCLLFYSIQERRKISSFKPLGHKRGTHIPG